MTTAILQTDALPGAGYPSILSFEALDPQGSLLSGLVGLYQFGADSGTSLINLADPTKPLTLVGAPTINSLGAVCNQGNCFETGLVETNAFTYAAVARVMTPSAPSGSGANLIGSLNPTNVGACMFLTNSAATDTLTTQATLSGPTNGIPNTLTMTGAVAGDYNTYIGRGDLTPIGCQSAWGKGGVLTPASPTGQITRGNTGLTLKVGGHTRVGAFTNSVDIALAAIWNRALTDDERTTFYALLRAFFAKGAIATL